MEWGRMSRAERDAAYNNSSAVKNSAELNDALDVIAAAHGVTPTGIAVAWITRHPAKMQVVLGKFLSGVLYIGLFALCTLYMPALIFVNGKVSVAHIASGYLGLMLVASATTAIGTFGSAVAKSPRSWPTKKPVMRGSPYIRANEPL